MNIDNFCNLGAALQNKQIEIGKQPQVYFYRSNEDSIYEMLSEGYFNALNLRVAKDDLILLYSPKDEQKVFAKVVSNSGGIVQITEMSEDDFQHNEMPTPSAEYLNKIIQYIGNTTSEYTNGFFYKCVENSGVYSWENIIVQDSYLKSETYNKTETYSKTESDDRFVHLTGDETIEGNKTFTGTTTAGSITSSGDITANNITVNTSMIVPTPASDYQAATKKYVDDAVSGFSGGYHPDLFAFEWSDKIRNSASWLRADTFSWQNGMVYQAGIKHLLADILMDRFYIIPVSGLNTNFYRSPDDDTSTQYAWTQGFSLLYTDNEFPEVGDDIYYNGAVVDTVDEFGTSTSSYVMVSGDTKKFYRDVSLDETGYYAWKYNTSEVYYTTSDSPVATDDAYTKSGGVFSATSTIDTVAMPPVAQTETVGSYTVTYYVADDGDKIVMSDMESTVLNIYNESGVAWYYVVDYTNLRFKLPRTKFGFTGYRDTVGNYVSESLPNIKNTTDIIIASNNVSRGQALYIGSKINDTNYSGTGQNNVALNFDASRSSSTYQDDAPVQQRATQMYLYFYVGNFTQTAIENTAGLNASLFNNKADIDAQNLNATGKSFIAKLGIPDYSSSINVPFSTSWTTTGQSYTAPFSGEFYLSSLSSANPDTLHLHVNGVEISRCGSAETSARWISISCRVKAGDVITVSSESNYSAVSVLAVFLPLIGG